MVLVGFFAMLLFCFVMAAIAFNAMRDSRQDQRREAELVAHYLWKWHSNSIDAWHTEASVRTAGSTGLWQTPPDELLFRGSVREVGVTQHVVGTVKDASILVLPMHRYEGNSYDPSIVQDSMHPATRENRTDSHPVGW